MGQISGQNTETLITRYQASRKSHDVTSAQLSIVVWKRSVPSEERFVGVSISGLLSLKSISLVSVWEVNFILFNSMLKYVEKMGLNKNISILMLFDCVRVNTGLGFH